MDSEQLWTGPRNEKHLHGCLGGTICLIDVLFFCLYILLEFSCALRNLSDLSCSCRCIIWPLQLPGTTTRLLVQVHACCKLARTANQFDFFILQMEKQFHSLNVMIDGEATTDDETIIDDFDIKDYIDPSMLGFISLLHSNLCFIIFLIICYMRSFDHCLCTSHMK